MAKNPADRRNAAREKARQIAQAQAQREKRAKTILWSGIGVVVVAVIAVIVVLVMQSMRPVVSPTTMVNGGLTLVKSEQGLNAVAGPDAGDNVSETLPAYDSGQQKDSAAVLEIYLDFQCPVCKSFEDTNGDAVQKLVNQGDLAVTYHPISILDGASGGNEYSTRSANAFMCAADAQQDDKLFAFTTALYEQQPPEGGSGMEDDQLIGIMESSGIDLDAKTTSLEGTPSVRDCVTNVDFERYVKAQTQEALDSGVQGTPQVKVNGQQIESDVWTDPQAFGQVLLKESGQIDG